MGANGPRCPKTHGCPDLGEREQEGVTVPVRNEAAAAVPCCKYLLGNSGDIQDKSYVEIKEVGCLSHVAAEESVGPEICKSPPSSQPPEDTVPRSAGHVTPVCFPHCLEQTHPPTIKPLPRPPPFCLSSKPDLPFVFYCWVRSCASGWRPLLDHSGPCVFMRHPEPNKCLLLFQWVGDAGRDNRLHLREVVIVQNCRDSRSI